MSEPEEQEVQEEKKLYDLGDYSQYVEMLKDEESDEEIKKNISNHLNKLVSDSDVAAHEVVFLYDDSSPISTFHSNRIYQAIKDLDKKKNILMVIQSGGGQIEPAYLISKTCKRLTKSKFNVAIPRKAKSAATLISLGANEIHMGATE